MGVGHFCWPWYLPELCRGFRPICEWAKHNLLRCGEEEVVALEGT